MHRAVIGLVIYVGRHCRRAKIFTCPSRDSNPGRWIYRQTLYHVAVKAGFYRKAVEMYLYIPRPCDAPIVGVCNCSMFCCTLLYVHSSIAIILMGKRELVALLNLSSWCLVMVERLFLGVARGCLRFVIVVFPDHTHLLFWEVT